MTDASRLNVGVFAGGLSWPVYVAEDDRVFRDAGLDVTVHPVSDSVRQITGLLDGTYDIVLTPFDNVVAYREGQGETELPEPPDVFAFMGGLDGCLRLVGGSRYASLADLKGAVVGVDAEHTGYTLAMYEILDRAGVPLGSYELSRTGGTTFRVKALEAGSIAATMVSSPQEIVPERHGFRRLADVRTSLGAYQAVCGVARRSWAEANAATLVSFIRAYVRANEWLRDPANAEAAAEIFVRHVAGSTESLATAALPIMTGAEGFQEKAAFSAAGAETVLRIRARFGVPRRPLRPWDAYVDETYYRRALDGDA